VHVHHQLHILLLRDVVHHLVNAHGCTLWLGHAMYDEDKQHPGGDM
jgi:hypothetical protein